MAIFIKKAERYAAFQYPGAGSTQSRINIYTADNYRLYILFYAQSASIPPNSYNSGSKIGVAHENASRFDDYLDLLRNEDPVWVTFNEDAKTYVVYAAGEPVGEGEI